MRTGFSTILCGEISCSRMSPKPKWNNICAMRSPCSSSVVVDVPVRAGTRFRVQAFTHCFGLCRGSGHQPRKRPAPPMHYDLRRIRGLASQGAWPCSAQHRRVLVEARYVPTATKAAAPIIIERMRMHFPERAGAPRGVGGVKYGRDQAWINHGDA